MIKVEVAYAESPTEQTLINVNVLPNATIEDAILASEILQAYPAIDLNQAKVGIFGQLAHLHSRLHPDDRVEIYRPLKIDPKVARRNRAKGLSKTN